MNCRKQKKADENWCAIKHRELHETKLRNDMRVDEAIALVEGIIRAVDGFELSLYQAELLVSAALGTSLSQLRILSQAQLSHVQEMFILRYLEATELVPVPIYLGYCEIHGIRLK